MNGNINKQPIDAICNGVVIASVVVCALISILSSRSADSIESVPSASAAPRVVNPSIRPVQSAGPASNAPVVELPAIVVEGHRNRSVPPIAKSVASQHAG